MAAAVDDLRQAPLWTTTSVNPGCHVTDPNRPEIRRLGRELADEPSPN